MKFNLWRPAGLFAVWACVLGSAFAAPPRAAPVVVPVAPAESAASAPVSLSAR
ncbi:MAG: hypothetical protein H7Y33_09300, partial [Cytophagales bacterium]|nr:hypothetical protein [Rhizobacter sp.]